MRVNAKVVSSLAHRPHPPPMGGGPGAPPEPLPWLTLPILRPLSTGLREREKEREQGVNKMRKNVHVWERQRKTDTIHMVSRSQHTGQHNNYIRTGEIG